MFFCGDYDGLERLVTELTLRKEKYPDFEHFFAVFSFGVCALRITSLFPEAERGH